jgi:hypothetical protein
MASSVMLATVWRRSLTMPMLEGASRVDDRSRARLVVGRAGGGVRGWSERGIGQNSGCEG